MYSSAFYVILRPTVWILIYDIVIRTVLLFYKTGSERN